MFVNDLLKQKKISKYRLSKESGISYTTLSNICSGKTGLEKCSAETVYKLAKNLGVSMEDLIEPYVVQRCSFEVFKSNVCHRLKILGDIDFIIEVLKKGDIRKYFEQKWYPESLYLLAMLDYISRENNVLLCSDYDDIRCTKLEKAIYPSSVIAMYAVSHDEQIKEQCMRDALPEFRRFNIAENEVRNVI